MKQTPKAQVRFRERAELLDFLLEVSAVTAETLDLDRLLANVADIIKDVVPHELIAILLYNERARSLRMRYSIGHRDEVAKNLVIPLGEGLPNAFTKKHRSLLVLIASRVATAIDNARLYRRVERQNRTLRVLAHLSQEFSSILEIDELLTKIALTIRALINFDSFTIFLVDEQHKLLRCRFSQRYDKKATTLRQRNNRSSGRNQASRVSGRCH